MKVEITLKFQCDIEDELINKSDFLTSIADYLAGESLDSIIKGYVIYDAEIQKE
jgi:hypothetical protein